MKHPYREHHKTVREPSPWALSSIFGAVVIALALSLACQLDHEDHSAEWGQSQELKDSQAANISEEQFWSQMQKLCNVMHGPNSAAVTLQDGSAGCTTRRAAVKAQVQL